MVSTSEAPDAEALYSPIFLRRDVVSIPANGWARIRFVADNPGAWLFHCHIEWCASVCLLHRAVARAVSDALVCAGTCTQA